jgi:uncharacterized membrane protein
MFLIVYFWLYWKVAETRQRLEFGSSHTRGYNDPSVQIYTYSRLAFISTVMVCPAFRKGLLLPKASRVRRHIFFSHRVVM